MIFLSAVVDAQECKYQDGVDAPDLAKAMSTWKPLAEKGDLCSQIAMGDVHFLGATAMENRGSTIYLYGPEKRRPNFTAAIHYYEMCSNAYACSCDLNLGEIYDDDPHVKIGRFRGQNPKKADTYYQNAIDLCYVGLTPEEHEKIVAEAKYLLGSLYVRKFDGPLYKEQGIRMIVEAANMGWTAAQVMSGNLFARSAASVTTPSAVMIEGDKWYLIAAPNDSAAKTYSELLEKKMAPADIANARQLASDWKPYSSIKK